MILQQRASVKEQRLFLMCVVLDGERMSQWVIVHDYGQWVIVHD